MSEEERNILIGRLSIQRSNDLKRIAAIKEDVTNINLASRSLWNSVISWTRSDPQALRDAVVLMHEYLNAEALFGLVNEFELLEQRVSDASQQLKDILGD